MCVPGGRGTAGLLGAWSPLLYTGSDQQRSWTVRRMVSTWGAWSGCGVRGLPRLLGHAPASWYVGMLGATEFTLTGEMAADLARSVSFRTPCLPVFLIADLLAGMQGQELYSWDAPSCVPRGLMPLCWLCFRSSSSHCPSPWLPHGSFVHIWLRAVGPGLGRETKQTLLPV